MEKEKSGAWVRLPLAVLQDERLSLYEAVVLALLIDKDTGTGQVKASAKELAEQASISRRKVVDSLKLLKNTGYIKDIQHEIGGTSTYTISQILPPKKRGGQAQYTSKKKKKADENAFCDMDHFEEDYEIFINNF